MIELLGLLLAVQGAGGLINRLAGATSPSWFVQFYVFPPRLHIIASVIILLVGAALLVTGQIRRSR